MKSVVLEELMRSVFTSKRLGTSSRSLLSLLHSVIHPTFIFFFLPSFLPSFFPFFLSSFFPFFLSSFLSYFLPSSASFPPFSYILTFFCFLCFLPFSCFLPYAASFASFIFLVFYLTLLPLLRSYFLIFLPFSDSFRPAAIPHEIYSAQESVPSLSVRCHRPHGSRSDRTCQSVLTHSR